MGAEPFAAAHAAHRAVPPRNHGPSFPADIAPFRAGGKGTLMLRTLAARLFAPLLLVGLAAAQEIQVPSGPLQVGKAIEIKVSDPSRANGSIVVTIDNGDPISPDKIEVEVKLDASGNGTANWTVGDWLQASFNAPGCKEVSRSVEEAGGSEPPRTSRR